MWCGSLRHDVNGAMLKASLRSKNYYLTDEPRFGITNNRKWAIVHMVSAEVILRKPHARCLRWFYTDVEAMESKWTAPTPPRNFSKRPPPCVTSIQVRLHKCTEGDGVAAVGGIDR